MKVTIVNKASYSRQFQYYRQWKFIVLKSGESLVLENITDPVEIAYYDSLNSAGYSVTFESETSSDSKTPEEVSPYEELSDDDLKRIIKNLGISTRVSKRWKLESIVTENLPEGKTFKDFL